MNSTLQRILELFDNAKLLDSKLTDKILEQTIGLPKDAIYNWRNGVSKSYGKYLYNIAKYFRVSIEYLKGETDDKCPIVANTGEIGNQIKRLSPSLQADFLEFLALAPKNPDTAERLLSFAVQELRFATQDH